MDDLRPQSPEEKVNHLRPKKRLRMSLSALLFGGFAFLACACVTAGYAWFSVSSLARVYNIDISYEQSKMSLKSVKDLSKDEGDPTYESIPDQAGVYSSTERLVFGPCSGMFQSDWDKEGASYKTTTPTLRTSLEPMGPNDPGQAKVGLGGYYSYELTFSSKRDCYVFLDQSTVLSANSDVNRAIAQERVSLLPDYDQMSASAIDKAVEEQLSAINRAPQAARVSFYGNFGYLIYNPGMSYDDETGEESGGDTYYAGRLDLNQDGYYDPTFGDKERIYGEYDASKVYDTDYDEVLSEDEGTPDPNTANSFFAASKKGLRPLKEEAVARMKEDGTFKKEDAHALGYYSVANTASHKHPLLYIAAGTTERLVMTLYLEGWDPDFIRPISGASLSWSVAFAGYYMSKDFGGPNLTPVA